MGGAGMVAAGTGIPALSGRLFFGDFLLARQAKESHPPPRGKRQIKNIRAADTPDKNKVGRKAVTACGQPGACDRGKRWALQA